MTIIFLHPQTKKLHICTETNMTKVVDLNDPHLLNYIPNDDILYVDNGHILQKSQFAAWLQGGIEPVQNPQPVTPTMQQPVLSNKLYLHTTNPGYVCIDDITTEQFPEGIPITGKYHFIPIDQIGMDLLEESHKFRWLLAKNKIEIVNEEYVSKNKHKFKKQSAGDAALDAITLKDDRRGAAESAASGMFINMPEDGTGAIPIYVQ